MKLAPIIPPLSLVRLARADNRTPAWKNQIGRYFRIGYYSRHDGTDCVWLVNDAGEYEQTSDQNQILTHFEIIERSKERSLYGANRPRIPPLPHRHHHNSNGNNGSPKLRTKSRPRAVA